MAHGCTLGVHTRPRPHMSQTPQCSQCESFFAGCQPLFDCWLLAQRSCHMHVWLLQVSRAFVGWAITLYLVYMIWVFVGDEWHQRGRPRPQRLDIKSIKDMLSGVYQGGGLGSRQNGVAGMGPTASAGAHNAAGELEESLLPWAVAEEEDSVLHEPVGFEQPLHPPASRYSGSSMMMGSGTGSSGLKRASTELSEMASAAVGQRGSVAGADLDLTAGSNPVHLLPQRTYSGTSPQTSYQTATDGIAEQPSWRRGSAASMQQPHLLNLGNQRYIDPKTYKQLVWADLADDQEEEVRLEREIAQQLLAGTRRQQTALTPGQDGYLLLWVLQSIVRNECYILYA